MPTMWSLIGRFFQVSLTIGGIMVVLGSLILILLGNETPGPICMAFGSGEMILGLVGYIYGSSGRNYRMGWPYISGIVFLVAGFFLASEFPMTNSATSSVGLTGLMIFSIGTPLLVSFYIRTRSVNIPGLYLLGSGLIVAGIPLLIADIIVSGGSSVYPAIAPVISGFEIILFSRVRVNLLNLSREVAIRSGNWHP